MTVELFFFFLVVYLFIVSSESLNCSLFSRGGSLVFYVFECFPTKTILRLDFLLLQTFKDAQEDNTILYKEIQNA